MGGLAFWTTIVVGLPLCLLVVVATLWQAPYLVVVLIWLFVLARRAYRRVDARFQQSVREAQARQLAQR